MDPTAPPADAPPPSYEEAKVHCKPIAGDEQGPSELERPPPYDGERTLPRHLDFLPTVVQTASPNCSKWYYSAEIISYMPVFLF
ncbi:unnamed protein product [Heligmosomoides polygyrus]|uniref:Uncharacterized protein n=1 Tax=Heligmosomoides polygyrus TaxID=6339 RepID=A0A183G1L6_HELPZ|nr:unnamed protein product [Heligmosomoides polygyrus]